MGSREHSLDIFVSFCNYLFWGGELVRKHDRDKEFIESMSIQNIQNIQSIQDYTEHAVVDGWDGEYNTSLNQQAPCVHYHLPT